MADSRNIRSSEGSKPESFGSRIDDLKGSLATLDAAVVQLCEAYLDGAPPKRRARVLAILAALGHDGQSEMFEALDGE